MKTVFMIIFQYTPKNKIVPSRSGFQIYRFISKRPKHIGVSVRDLNNLTQFFIHTAKTLLEIKHTPVHLILTSSYMTQLLIYIIQLRPKQNICVVPVARPCLILTPDPKHFFLYPVLNIFFYVSERPTFFPVVPDFMRYDNTVFRSTNSVNKNGGARRAHCLLACKVMWSHPEKQSHSSRWRRMTRSAMFSTDGIIQPTLTTKRDTVSPPNAAWGWMLRASNFT